MNESTEYSKGYAAGMSDGYIEGHKDGKIDGAMTAASAYVKSPCTPRLTPEEQRYIELGKAVEYAAKKHEPAPIVIVSIEGFMGWYRKEVTE